jgi:hypothetical protein
MLVRSAVVLAAALPSSPSCWRNQALSITPPPLMQHQRLLRRGLGVALWSRRHQRADLHAADRCRTCLRPGPEGSGETAERVLVGAES